MHTTNRVFASITAFFYISILSGCASLSINVRDFLRNEKPNTRNAALAEAEPRVSQTILAANHIPATVFIMGFLNKPPDADRLENSPDHTNAPYKEYLAPAVYYDVVRDRHAQGNRPIKIGTGFIIEASGDRAFVLTNNHVQSNTDDLIVFFYDGRKYPARVIWASPDINFDVAFLEIKKRNPANPAETFVAAKLGDSDAAAAGGRYLMIGHPYNLLYSAHTGTLAQIRRSFFSTGDAILQMDMNVYPGHSGSPLINERGEVDGVVFAMKVDKKNNRITAIGWAIPINPIKEKFREIKTALLP